MQPAINTNGRCDRKIIYEDDMVSIFRIIWYPGSRTPKHDHGQSIGSTLIIRGRIFEIQDGKKSYIKKGKMTHITSNIKHIVGNDSLTETAESIHIYYPKLKMTTYPDDPKDKELLLQIQP